MDHIINDESVGKIFEVYIMRDKRSALFYKVFASTQSAMEELVRCHLSENHAIIEPGEIKLKRFSLAPSIMFLEKTEAGKDDELNRLIKKEENFQKPIITGVVFRGQLFCVDKKILNFEILANDKEMAEMSIKDRMRKNFPQHWPAQIEFVNVINGECILEENVVKVVKTSEDEEKCWEVY